MAGSYDALWPRYIAATARETISSIDLAGARAILDVGCGSGTMLDSIAQQAPMPAARPARLVGVDLSTRMLDVARRKLSGRASLVAGDAARLPFRLQAFDAALSASVLHFWPDPGAALGEIHRVLVPRGRVAITDWCGDFRIQRMRDRVLRRLEPAHVRVYRSAELEAMLARIGFRDIRVECWRLGWRWGLMTAVATRPVDSRPADSAARP